MTTRFVDSAATYVTGLTEADAHKTITVAAVGAAAVWAAGDIIRVKSTHNETTGAGAAGARSFSCPATPGLQILSVAFDGAGTGALTPGAVIDVGASSSSCIVANSGFAYINGLTFTAGTNNNAACDLVICTAASPIGVVFDGCTFSTPSASTSALTFIGQAALATSDDCSITFINPVWNRGNSSSTTIQCGVIRMYGGTWTGTAPTTVFNTAASFYPNFICYGTDFSGVAWTNLVNVAFAAAGKFTFTQCKFRSSYTLTTGAFAGPGGITVEAFDCDSGDVHYNYMLSVWQGTIVASNSIYADASDGTNSFSLLMTGNANTSFTYPLVSPPFVFHNSDLGAQTTTVEVTNDGTTYTDAQLWQETEVKTAGGSPLATLNLTDRVADIVTAGANQASSTKTWTGTGGFGAEVKQKLVTSSFTPAEVGAISVVVKLAANDNVYVSPNVNGGARQWLSPFGAYINEAAAASTVVHAGVIGG